MAVTNSAMTYIAGTPLAFPSAKLSGGNAAGVPSGNTGELLVSQLAGKYSHLVKAGKVHSSASITTAMVIYSTAAGTGGPLIWNPPGSGIDVHILSASVLTRVVTTVAGGIGFTGAGGQSVAPTTTTAADAAGNVLIGGAASAASAFRLGTPANAGTVFIPLFGAVTGALTVQHTYVATVDIDGAIIIPPGAWGALAGNATLSTLQVTTGLVWAELPT